MPRPYLALAYQFQWSVLWTSPYLGWLLKGILTTLALAGLAWVLAAGLGAVFGAIRTVPSRGLRGLGATYVEFFRNVPLLVWMFLWYFGAPQLLPDAAQDWLNRHHGEFSPPSWPSASITGRGWPRSCAQASSRCRPPSWRRPCPPASRWRQAYRLVLLPIALRLIVPPLTNDSLNLLKNSSLALTISVAETTFMTRQIESYTAKGFEAITAGTLIYLALCLCVSTVMARVERRVAIPGLIVRGGGAEH